MGELQRYGFAFRVGEECYGVWVQFIREVIFLPPEFLVCGEFAARRLRYRGREIPVYNLVCMLRSPYRSSRYGIVFSLRDEGEFAITVNFILDVFVPKRSLALPRGGVLRDLGFISEVWEADVHRMIFMVDPVRLLYFLKQMEGV